MKITNFEIELSKVFEDRPNMKLYEAMNYSLSAGGKRFRPHLMFSSAEMLGVDSSLMIDIAIAIELIHTYSLIHDDLPCLDNDDLRRGKLTNHKVYGEDYALLAGDNLQSLAFEYIYKALAKGFDIKLLKYFSIACVKMVEGQSLDIDESYKVDIETLENVHYLKTGALIEFCMIAPLFYLKDYSKLSDLSLVGRNLGIAFQIKDDILDVSATSEELGKSNSDIDNNKLTYTSLLGVDKSEEFLENKLKETTDILEEIDCLDKSIIEIVNYCKYRVK
ncbi:MAG: polyprenyl synthetase family protein [Bacilli bacterium]